MHSLPHTKGHGVVSGRYTDFQKQIMTDGFIYTNLKKVGSLRTRFLVHMVKPV